MKTISIRCSVCSLELYFEDTEHKVKRDLHEPMKLGSLSIGDTTSFPFEGKHYCSPTCIEIDISSHKSGVPLEEDRLKSMAEKLGYELSRKPKEDVT